MVIPKQTISKKNVLMTYTPIGVLLGNPIISSDVIVA